MAQLVGVFNAAHSPFCYMAPENWETVRANRPPYRADVPIDEAQTNIEKAARVQADFCTLREKLAEARPDVIVVFGDDQNEQFDFSNHPSLSVFVGESFVGRTPSGNMGGLGGAPGASSPSAAAPMQAVLGHPSLATYILMGMLAAGYDPAFMLGLAKPERGMCHAVMNPLTSLTDFSVPVVPLLLNAYYAPQLTAQRCYEVGRTVRQLIDTYPEDLRIAVVGSGGLWHTPGQALSHLDEEFDRQGLEYLVQGDIKAWAFHFDSYRVAADDPSQSNVGRGTSGLPTPGGPQGGTRETCNWIGAAAVAEGRAHTIVDYVPIYASPVGAAFSYATAV